MEKKLPKIQDSRINKLTYVFKLKYSFIFIKFLLASQLFISPSYLPQRNYNEVFIIQFNYWLVKEIVQVLTECYFYIICNAHSLKNLFMVQIPHI